MRKINWDKLKEYGIIVIKAEDIIKVDLQDPQYICNDGFHPNAKAWEIIVPALVKELNL